MPVEQLLTGNWSGGDAGLPGEWFDFELMTGMGWRWEMLMPPGWPEGIPPYVKRFCRDFLRMRASAGRGSE